MTLRINKKDYELYFGLDFIAYLDRKYHISENGFQIGQGLTYVVAQIELGNPLILVDLILAGCQTSTKPKEVDIKKYIETEADIEVLMNDFLAKLNSSPATKFTMKKLAQMIES